MPVIAAAGAIVLFGYFMARAMSIAKQESDFRAANGWSLDEVAAELTANFDRDRDGRLAFDAVQGVRTLGESARTTTNTFSEALPSWVAPSGTMAIRERRRMYSIEPTLRKADADGDGVVTRAELHRLLKAYDPDGNGRVTAAERARALSEFGEVLVSTDTQTVGIVPPPAKPKSTTPGTQPVPRQGSKSASPGTQPPVPAR